MDSRVVFKLGRTRFRNLQRMVNDLAVSLLPIKHTKLPLQRRSSTHDKKTETNAVQVTKTLKKQKSHCGGLDAFDA